MANEGSITLRVSVSTGGLSESIVEAIKFDVSAARVSAGTQTIGIAHEAVVLGADLGTPGYAYFENLDVTNFVQIGIDVAAAFYPLAKLLPGQLGLFPLATGTFYAKADLAACNLLFKVFSV